MATSLVVRTSRALVAGVVAIGALASVASAQLETVVALNGANQRPNPGSPTGTGTAIVLVDPSDNSVCYELTVTLTPPATAAHIHRGAADAAGPIVVPFDAPASGMSTACVEGVDAALIAELMQNPGGFYVNVHNAEFPAGAIRGQLGQ